jgi:hypothetical protein
MLSAERARIRSEYETRLPDIETDLAAIDRLLSHRTDQSAVDMTSNAPEAEQTAQMCVEAAYDASGGVSAVPASPEPVEVATAVAPARPPRAPNWRRELAGLRQEDAAVRIAEHAGGTVSIVDVARVLMEVGLTRATGPGANGQVSHVLSRSTRFERVAKGTYRLVEQPAPDTSESLVLIT